MGETKTGTDAGIEFPDTLYDAGQLNFLSYAPCVFKNTFKDGLHKALTAHRTKTGKAFNNYGPIVGCHDFSDDPYKDLWQEPDIDSLPDALASKGISDFLRRQFMERFVKRGCFTNVWGRPVHPMFQKAGLIDPDGWFTVYSVMPFVMLADMRKLGSLPPPKRWSDLIQPHYRDSVIFAGPGDRLADTPLFHLWAQHGEDGLTQLADNVKYVWSGAEIAKEAGSTNPSGAAIYVLNWFFARSCPRTDVTKIIWPDDGAIAAPIYLLVKKNRVREAAAAIDYIFSTEFGNSSAQSCFPVVHPEVDNHLPEGASFKWIGWDYVKSHDVVELADHAQKLFFSLWNEKNRSRSVK